MNEKMRSSVMGLLLTNGGSMDVPLGLLMGQMIGGQRKEPLGYLYGETLTGDLTWLTSYYGALPSAAEWNRTEYPYAVMYFASLFTHILFVSKEPWYGTGEPYMYTDHTGLTTQFGETIRNDSSGLWFIDQYDTIEGTAYTHHWWRLMTEEEINDYTWKNYNGLGQNKDTNGDGKYDYGAEGLINWSNHDIISADGKAVLIAKSEPIPIYE